jgi:D-xylose transport system substrate-binding protein
MRLSSRIFIIIGLHIVLYSNVLAAQQPELYIGVSLPSPAQERWGRDKTFFEQEAQNRKLHIKVQVASNNRDQLSQCENLLALGINCLVITPIDALVASRIATKAKMAGASVISYDRLILNADLDAYITFNLEMVGRLQAQHALSRAPHGRYLVLSGSFNDNNAVMYLKGAMDMLQPSVAAGNIELLPIRVATDWSMREAMKITEDALLQSAGALDAVIAPNDSCSQGVIQALKAYGLAGMIPVTGQDAEASAIRRIMAGTQSMTLFKDLQKLVKITLDIAQKIHAHEPLEHQNSVHNGLKNIPLFTLDPEEITVDNVQQWLLERHFHPQLAKMLLVRP